MYLLHSNILVCEMHTLIQSVCNCRIFIVLFQYSFKNQKLTVRILCLYFIHIQNNTMLECYQYYYRGKNEITIKYSISKRSTIRSNIWLVNQIHSIRKHKIDFYQQRQSVMTNCTKNSKKGQKNCKNKQKIRRS